MSSRIERVITRSLLRQQQVNNVNGTRSEHQRDQQSAGQVSFVVSGPPMIDVDAIEDDDDVVESTASAFHQARRHNSGVSRRGPLVVDVESGCTTRVKTRKRHHQSDQADVELNNSTKSKAVAPVEEPKFNCPICMCPFTEEMSTKCGHIFCKNCIRIAISRQAKCPTCRKKVTSKDLIRVFLPTTR